MKKKLTIIGCIMVSTILLVVGVFWKFSTKQTVEIETEVIGVTKTEEEIREEIEEIWGVEDDTIQTVTLATTKKNITSHSSQYVNGIPVLDSDIMITSDKDGKVIYSAGTYYEGLNEIIDTEECKADINAVRENIDDLAKVCNEYDLILDRESVQPIIIYDEDIEKVLIGQRFDVYCEETGESFTFTTDLRVEKMYGFSSNSSNYNDFSQYSTTVIEKGSLKIPLLTNEGEIYALDPEYGFFVGSDEKEINEKGGYDFSADSIYLSDNWDSPRDMEVLDAMGTMRNVCDFYKDKCGIIGADNQGGLYKLIIKDKPVEGVARCSGNGLNSYNITLGTTPDKKLVSVAPEIVCHEMNHMIMTNVYAFHGKPSYESGAVSEALGDIFAELYCRDEGWIIGRNAVGDGYDYSKDLKKSEIRTFNEYINYGLLSFLKFGSNVDAFINHMLNVQSIGAEDHVGSSLISHTIYEIWDEVLEKDFDKLTDIMAYTIACIHVPTTFSDFRTAFLLGMESECSRNTVDKAKVYFDKVGIKESIEKPVMKKTVHVKDYKPSVTPSEDEKNTEQITIEVHWDGPSVNGSSMGIEATLNNPKDTGDYDHYVSSSGGSGSLTLILDDMDNDYNFSACVSNEPDFSGYILDSNIYAEVYIGDTESPVIYSLKKDYSDVWRSYTGVKLWGPFGISKGMLVDYDPSWMNITWETEESEESEEPEGYSDEELIDLASEYYYSHNDEYPPIVEIDHEDGNLVTIHLYDIIDGHTGTYAWYEVDRYTCEGEDILGNYINLLE